MRSAARPRHRLLRAIAACLTAVLVACGGAGSAAPTGHEGAGAPAARVPAVQATRLSGFEADRAWAHLERQVEIGPRPSGSDAGLETRRYIVAELEAAGIAVREQTFVARTPLGDVPMANVIGTIAGRRPERIGLASHYDTKLYDAFRFVGANDGGSSTAVLLELGRVLAGAGPDFTIELLFLDGEEARRTEWQGDDNTYGSRHYVRTAQADGTLEGLRALILLDMVGDRDLRLRRDSNSTPWLVDLIWGAAEALGHRSTFSNQLTTVEDDHIPFLRAGVPAVDLIDLDTPARRGTWHTADDTLEWLSRDSLQIVGDVVLAALPGIEQRLASRP